MVKLVYRYSGRTIGTVSQTEYQAMSKRRGAHRGWQFNGLWYRFTDLFAIEEQ